MENVYHFLDNLNINENKALVVAVSYGPDSMFLLDLIRNKYNKNMIVCAHVHHNHRKESDYEAEMLKQYCDNNNIKFEMMKITEYKNNKFTEEEARNKRYEFFDKLMNKYNSKYLFTAHHGDDLIETIMMRLVRGSSLKGYSGIHLISKRKNYNLVRPLLYLTKDNIMNFCIENKINYAVDKSNLDNDYTRNRYRNNLLPMLKIENKDVHMQFLKFSTALKESEEYLCKLTDDLYSKVLKNDFIDINSLLEEETLLIKRVIMKYFSEYYADDISLLNSNHILAAVNLLKNTKTNGKISLPNNINLIKSYNKLYFDKKKEYNSYCFEFDGFTRLPNNMVIEKNDVLDDTSNYATALDSKEISLPIYIRNKNDGDKIEILGLKGSKKIKDIFIDEKVDFEIRKNYPVVIDSKGEVLWLPGLKKSKYDKSKQGNYDIILKYQREVYNDTTK